MIPIALCMVLDMRLKSMADTLSIVAHLGIGGGTQPERCVDGCTDGAAVCGISSYRRKMPL